MLINLWHVIPNYGWFLFIGPPCASTHSVRSGTTFQPCQWLLWAKQHWKHCKHGQWWSVVTTRAPICICSAEMRLLFCIWRWKPGEVLGCVINKCRQHEKCKMTFSSLYFYVYELLVGSSYWLLSGSRNRGSWCSWFCSPCVRPGCREAVAVTLLLPGEVSSLLSASVVTCLFTSRVCVAFTSTWTNCSLIRKQNQGVRGSDRGRSRSQRICDTVPLTHLKQASLTAPATAWIALFYI